jgi:hypothetical protein
MIANGPAVELVNGAEPTVGRMQDLSFWVLIYLRPDGSEARRGFCHPGTRFLDNWRDRGTRLQRSHFWIPVQNVVRRHWRRDRGTKLHRSHFWVPVQKFAGVQMRVSGYNDLKKFILGAGLKCKNRDEFINSTVRVRRRSNIKTITVARICHEVKVQVIMLSPGQSQIVWRVKMHYIRNICCIFIGYHVLQIKCLKLFEFETNQVVCLSPITRIKVMEFVKAESDYGFAVRRRSSKSR